MMPTVRAGRGLGDSIYLQSVVRELARASGLRWRVRSDYPDVFLPLGDSVNVIPFGRDGVTLVAHYTTRKHILGSSQFEDMCIAARIDRRTRLVLGWQLRQTPLVEALRRVDRPIVVVGLPRTPMGRTDGFGIEIMPRPAALQSALDLVRQDAYIVQIGSGPAMFELQGIDCDLANRTSIADVLDVAMLAAGFYGFPSFLIPLAESVGRPCFVVWSRRIATAGSAFIRSITPGKLLQRHESTYGHDDDPTRGDGLASFIRAIHRPRCA
jgi:hypothetical protein